MTTPVLCVNLGSRTAKLTLLEVPGDAVPGMPPAPSAARETPLAEVAAEAHLGALGAERAGIVAYRVVRSTEDRMREAAPFDARTRDLIAAAREFAPLHVGPVLAAFDALRERLPRARHVAVFDTAFHRTIPDAAAAYGLPYDDFAAGWRKLGFHGLSHAYAAQRAAVLLGDRAPRRKLVSLHLGGGASVCAIDGARSVDTTMGFTPLDGLIMETRSGSVDPGLLLAYMRRTGCTIDALEDRLTNHAGLLGLAGSADMREVLAAAERQEPRAVLAVDAFVYRLRTAIGAMTAALRGLDAIAFLGGIGENAPLIRARACARFGYLGVHVDEARNAEPPGDVVISPDGAAVAILRIHTREDWMLALTALRAA